MNGLQHLGKGNASLFEHSANLDGELLAAFTTFLEAETLLALGVLCAGLRADAGKIIHPATHYIAMRAGCAICPDDAFKELKNLGFVVKMGGERTDMVSAPLTHSLQIIAELRGFIKYTIAFLQPNSVTMPIKMCQIGYNLDLAAMPLLA